VPNISNSSVDPPPNTHLGGLVTSATKPLVGRSSLQGVQTKEIVYGRQVSLQDMFFGVQVLESYNMEVSCGQEIKVLSFQSVVEPVRLEVGLVNPDAGALH
jgi:hypothetical protein